jgi:hypothetical protein
MSGNILEMAVIEEEVERALTTKTVDALQITNVLTSSAVYQDVDFRVVDLTSRGQVRNWDAGEK